MHTTQVLVTITHSKPLNNVTDIVAGRIYTVDGVENTTATLATAPVNTAVFDLPPIQQLVEKFNELYKLPNACVPCFPETGVYGRTKRLDAFVRTLQAELWEQLDIINKLEEQKCSDTEVLADIADWLGDIIIYCMSEMLKYGLVPDDVLRIIMASNMSKLGVDGKPIYNEDGKVLKGPNYWKPEPMLLRMIEARIRQAQQEK